MLLKLLTKCSARPFKECQAEAKRVWNVTKKHPSRFWVEAEKMRAALDERQAVAFEKKRQAGIFWAKLPVKRTLHEVLMNSNSGGSMRTPAKASKVKPAQPAVAEEGNSGLVVAEADSSGFQTPVAYGMCV